MITRVIKQKISPQYGIIFCQTDSDAKHFYLHTLTQPLNKLRKFLVRHRNGFAILNDEAKTLEYFLFKPYGVGEEHDGYTAEIKFVKSVEKLPRPYI